MNHEPSEQRLWAAVNCADLGKDVVDSDRVPSRQGHHHPAGDRPQPPVVVTPVDGMAVTADLEGSEFVDVDANVEPVVAAVRGHEGVGVVVEAAAHVQGDFVEGQHISVRHGH